MEKLHRFLDRLNKWHQGILMLLVTAVLLVVAIYTTPTRASLRHEQIQAVSDRIGRHYDGKGPALTYKRDPRTNVCLIYEVTAHTGRNGTRASEDFRGVVACTPEMIKLIPISDGGR